MKIFIGSSKESIELVRLVEVWLEELDVQPLPWDTLGLFRPGTNTLLRLIEISKEVDAAIFIFSEDDKVWYRNDSSMQPRDNILIEYGMFIGSLGVSKAIILKNGRPRTATDLYGISYIDGSEARRIRSKYEIRLWCDEISKSKSDIAPNIFEHDMVQRNYLLFEGFKNDIIKNFNKFRDRINPTILQDLKAVEDSNFDANQYPERLKSKMREFLQFYEFFGSILKTVTTEELQLNEVDYFALGMAAYLEGKLEDAKTFFKDSLKLDSNNYLTLFRLGGIYYLLDKYERAIECFSHSIQSNPNFILTYYNKGIVFMNLKNYQGACEAFEKALSIDDQHLPSYNNLAGVYIIQRNYHAAHNCLDTLLKLDDSYSKAYYNKACVYSETKNKSDALQFLKKAITFEPGFGALATKDPSFEWLSKDPSFLKCLRQES